MSITTSVLPPAYAYVRQHGDLLTQLGATKVEATDSMTIAATFADGAAAANASALLKDTVWGAKLVIGAEKSNPNARYGANAGGIADLLSGVKGIEVYQVAEANGTTSIYGLAPDATTKQNLAELVDTTPMPRVHVSLDNF
jgi:hypothetical protein